MQETAPWRIWIPPISIGAQEEDTLHVLLWQVYGSAVVQVDGGPRALGAGQALWVPVGVRHEFTVAQNSVTMPVFFEAADTATTLQPLALVTVDEELRALLVAYDVSWHTISKPVPDLARQVLSLLEERPAPGASSMPVDGPARAIAQALRFNPGDSRSVQELADSVHTSTRTVERAFLAQTGMTLRQWRIGNRVDAAALFLRSNPAGATIAAVAHRVGYTNVNAFRRVFKAQFGMSPMEYEQRYRTVR